MGDAVSRIAGELAGQVAEDWAAIVAVLEIEDELELLPDDLEVSILDEGVLFRFASAGIIFSRVRGDPAGVCVMTRCDEESMMVDVYRDGRGLESTSRQPLDLAGAVWN